MLSPTHGIRTHSLFNRSTFGHDLSKEVLSDSLLHANCVLSYAATSPLWAKQKLIPQSSLENGCTFSSLTSPLVAYLIWLTMFSVLTGFFWRKSASKLSAAGSGSSGNMSVSKTKDRSKVEELTKRSQSSAVVET